jgi:hypothetical protein
MIDVLLTMPYMKRAEAHTAYERAQQPNHAHLALYYYDDDDFRF